MVRRSVAKAMRVRRGTMKINGQRKSTNEALKMHHSWGVLGMWAHTSRKVHSRLRDEDDDDDGSRSTLFVSLLTVY